MDTSCIDVWFLEFLFVRFGSLECYLVLSSIIYLVFCTVLLFQVSNSIEKTPATSQESPDADDGDKKPEKEFSKEDLFRIFVASIAFMAFIKVVCNILEMPGAVVPAQVPPVAPGPGPDSGPGPGPANISPIPDSNISPIPDSNISPIPDSNISVDSTDNGSGFIQEVTVDVATTAVSLSHRLSEKEQLRAILRSYNEPQMSIPSHNGIVKLTEFETKLLASQITQAKPYESVFEGFEPDSTVIINNDTMVDSTIVSNNNNNND